MSAKDGHSSILAFASNNVGVEYLRLSVADESHSGPISATSEDVSEGGFVSFDGRSIPLEKYTTSAEVRQMWNELLEQFEEKLNPLYEKFMSDLDAERSGLRCGNFADHHKCQEKLNQQHTEIAKAWIRDISSCIEKKFIQISGEPYVASESSFHSAQVCKLDYSTY